MTLFAAHGAVQSATPTPALLVVGQRAPDVFPDRWQVKKKNGVVVKNTSANGGLAGMGDLEQMLASMQGDPSLDKLHGATVIVHRTPLANAARWKQVLDLAEANRDRGALAIAIVAEEDATAATQRLENEGLAWPVGVVGPDPISPYARDEFALIGPSGELVALTTRFEDIEAVFDDVLARPSTLPLERVLAVPVAPLLADYWTGRYAVARDAADRLAKKLERGTSEDDKRAAADAAYLVDRIDAQQKELVAEAAKARADAAIERLVDLDEIFSRGFRGPVSRTAADALKLLVAQSLMSVRMYDWQKFRELTAKRPLYFPRRDDATARKLVKQLEAFVKSSSNDAAAQQRSRALIERFRQRHP